MLKVHEQRHIRFATIEKPTAWVIVAVLVETRDGETVALSEPRIVKIIPKTHAGLALPGTSSIYNKIPLALPIPKVECVISCAPILSPFVSLFTYIDAGTIPSVSARPPTQ